MKGKVHFWLTDWGNLSSWQDMVSAEHALAGHMVPTVRKQGQKNNGVRPTFFFLYLLSTDGANHIQVKSFG